MTSGNRKLAKGPQFLEIVSAIAIFNVSTSLRCLFASEAGSVSAMAILRQQPFRDFSGGFFWCPEIAEWVTSGDFACSGPADSVSFCGPHDYS